MAVIVFISYSSFLRYHYCINMFGKLMYVTEKMEILQSQVCWWLCIQCVVQNLHILILTCTSMSCTSQIFQRNVKYCLVRRSYITKQSIRRCSKFGGKAGPRYAEGWKDRCFRPTIIYCPFPGWRWLHVCIAIILWIKLSWWDEDAPELFRWNGGCEAFKLGERNFALHFTYSWGALNGETRKHYNQQSCVKHWWYDRV